MRVISGKYKGRKLSAVRGEVRPTSDRLRESLFSVLQGQIGDSIWLDLFAGTGAVGIEALSRGARHVIFNEKNRASLRLIERNLTICGIEQGVEVWALDAFVALKESLSEEVISHFFLDPPYRFGRYAKLLQKILDSRLWRQDSLIILEISKKAGMNFIPTALSVERGIEAGDSRLLLLRALHHR